MRAFLRILFITGMVLCFSCEEQGLLVKCSECTTDEPIETELKIKLGENYYKPTTTVRVYQGDIEDNIPLETVIVNGSSTSTKIKVRVNKKYTVTATYIIDNDEYIVVDSVTPRVRYDEEQCEDPCYYVYDRTVHLVLKYR